MKVPAATYRVQLNQNFRFVDAEKLVPYLQEIGVSHLYSSPQYQARKGSTHGYDVADPTHLNSDLGTEEDFEKVIEQLRQRGMGLLLDIVPNHMAASPENPWWMDVLEYGQSSAYSRFFDIDWKSSGSKSPEVQQGRVVLPVLADFYERVLLNQDIVLKLDQQGFHVDVEGSRFPINPGTYRFVFEAPQKPDVPALRKQESTGKIDEILGAIKRALSQHKEDPQKIASAKANLWERYRTDQELRAAIDESLRTINGVKGDGASFDSLHLLLSRQAYRLAYWRTAYEEINYRRFFGLNDLVALRIEDPAVFAARHARTIEMVEAGKLDGLRIDHIDGLRDPLEYLERLQRIPKPAAQVEEDSDALHIYSVVEKITSGAESLPREWPTAGTTGYDYLNAVNTLFIDAAGSRTLEAIYREFTGIHSSFSETWYVRKKQVMEDLFASDIRILSKRLACLAALDRLGCDIPRRELIRGLKEITACLPIYRTYCRDLSLPQRDHGFLERAFTLARDRAPLAVISDTAFEFLKRAFLLAPSSDLRSHKEAWLDFLLGWQQFTGAVMAKGLEDTAFFVHHGLISLNEVGCNPLRREIRFGVPAFHHHNQRAFHEHPFTLNATSTHDTKWSEDVRARINVLSEMPEEWKARLVCWTELNQSRKTVLGERAVPSPNEEVLLYQSMLGIWPLEATVADPVRQELRERIETFMLKAAREAKTHSSWVSPNEAHESALRNFITAIFEPSADDQFLCDFSNFSKKIAIYGACNALAQVLLKITSPGVPDFFQGNELWNFRLTDPDSRNNVDFAMRQEVLSELNLREGNSDAVDPSRLLDHWQDGRIKLFLTKMALNYRLANRELFLRGEYLPLEAEGARRECVCGYVRNSADTWALTVVPRLVTRLATQGAFPLGTSAWGAGCLVLPGSAPASWTNIFTGENIVASGSRRKKRLALGDIFSRLPFALLVPSAPQKA